MFFVNILIVLLTLITSIEILFLLSVIYLVLNVETFDFLFAKDATINVNLCFQWELYIHDSLIDIKKNVLTQSSAHTNRSNLKEI